MQTSLSSVANSLWFVGSGLARRLTWLKVHRQPEIRIGEVRVLASAVVMVITGLWVASPTFGQSCTDPQNATRTQNCIWSNSSVPPTVDDGGTTAMEVGVKFTADTGGYITGIRFYKAPGNTGTHVGDLWTTGGILLATATFTGETASAGSRWTLPRSC